MIEYIYVCICVSICVCVYMYMYIYRGILTIIFINAFIHILINYVLTVY
jgi:hypothetical protein